MGDSMNNWIDFNSQITMQRDLVAAMGNSPSASEAPDIARINSNLAAIAGNLDAAKSSVESTLTFQKEVNDILVRENNRLVDRKNAIDKAYDGQKRMVALTDSTTAKNKAYNQILFILVVVLVVVVVIKFLYSFEMIPAILLDIINIVVISVGVIYCVYLYIDIKRRSNMDFNQITLAEPKKKSAEDMQKDAEKNAKSGNLLGAALNTNMASGCKGSACCPTGSTFNEKYNVCAPNVVPYGTTGLTSSNSGDFRFFANTAASPITFEWGNANARCTGLANYDATILGCKPTTSGFTTMTQKNSAHAEPFSATEYTKYSRV